jgi:hypothetical protein
MIRHTRKPQENVKKREVDKLSQLAEVEVRPRERAIQIKSNSLERPHPAVYPNADIPQTVLLNDHFYSRQV